MGESSTQFRYRKFGFASVEVRTSQSGQSLSIEQQEPPRINSQFVLFGPVSSAYVLTPMKLNSADFLHSWPRQMRLEQKVDIRLEERPAP
jgi:hypothetical protein